MVIGPDGLRIPRASIVLKKGGLPIAEVKNVYIHYDNGVFLINGDIISGAEELEKLKSQPIVDRVEFKLSKYTAWRVTITIVNIPKEDFKMIAQNLT